MSKKPKSAEAAPPASTGPAATEATAGTTAVAAPAAKTVVQPGWSIEVATRKGRTQPRYRIGRAFGPEAVSIAVDDLTSDQLKALHDDAELVVTPKDESEENGN
ncbi:MULTISPECIES: hypothetical protein [unclassified Bradyrhizobium]|uniref:hypothetical protein n=1 Tax=unclassified Bradyrhizobium TaxID=2631580 RepID=UPI0028EC955B|nr:MULTISPECIES: hypothetical protein [unclassified Bradyrhizobium]